MPKFPFNYCIFLAMMLCPMIAFGLTLKQSILVGCIVFVVVFAVFIIIFAIQQLMSTQLLSILYLMLSSIVFIIIKLLIKTYLPDIYSLIYFDFNYILLPILLCGVLINYALDDKNDVKIHKQFFGCIGILLLNIVSYSVLGFLREILAYGTVWDKYVSSNVNTFFATPVFSLIYIVIVFGVLNSMLVLSKKNKIRYKLYVDKMETSLKSGRTFK